MTTEEQLEELLLRWEELVEAGQPATAEELCGDRPELVASLQRRIEAMRAMDWLSASPASPPLSATRPDVVLAPGSEPIPDYRLVRRVGRGGFSEVWEATGPGGIPLALKFVPRTERTAAVEWRAVEALKDVHHPHLMSLFGAWANESFFIFAMELAEHTLEDRRAEAASQGLPGIPREELLEWLRQAAEGIDHLHAKGVQHRDIKARNLLLVGGCVKVADFGLARVLSHTVTGHTGSLTLAFAAPEFFEGRTTRQSDQYSLAVTYCHLRGGRLPFEGTPAQVVAGHLHKAPDLSMLPAEERPAVARALAKKPSNRWPGCREFVAALRDGSRSPASRVSWKSPWLWAAATILAVGVALAMFVLAPRQARLPEPGVQFVRSFDRPPAPGNIRCVDVGYVGSPLDRLVALSNGTGGPTLWDVKTGNILRHFAAEAGPSVALAPFSMPLGVTGDDSGAVVLWDLGSGNEVRRFTGHEASVSSVAFSLDGRRVLSASCDRTVRLWDRETGKELCCCRGHDSIVTSAAFGPDGRRALSGGWDGTVRLWDLETGSQLKQFNGHTSRVTCVAFSQDGRFGLSGGLDGTVRKWDLASGKEEQEWEAENDQVRSVLFLKDDRYFSVGERTIRIWAGTDPKELCRSPRLPSAGQSAALLNLEAGPHALVGTEGDGILLWSLPER